MKSGKHLLVTLSAVCLAILASLAGPWCGSAYGAGEARGPDKVVVSQEQAPPARQEIRFERLSIADGLSQSTVTTIFQDRQGFMWFGTQGGLNKHDGHQFTVYKHNADDSGTLSDNQVNAIYQDRYGELWIGTERGLDRLERASGTFIHYRHEPENPPSLSVGAVLSIYEDRAGTLWIGTGSGLNRFDRATQTFTHDLQGHAVRVIYEDQRGELWIGTSGGLHRFERAGETFIHYAHAPDDPGSLSDNRVRALFENRQGALWVGTDGGGLNQLVPSTQTFIHYRHAPDNPHSLSDDRVQAILEDDQGQLWVGTQGGLDLLEPLAGPTVTGQSQGQERFMHYRHEPSDSHSLSDDVVYALYEDRSGVLWVGTRGGLSKHNRAANRFKLYQQGSNGLSDNFVQAVYEDRNGALWIGTFAGGLNRLERDSSLTVYQHDPDDPGSLSANDVRAIYEDRDGGLWVGTDLGLDQFIPQTETFMHYPSLSGSRVTVLSEDRLGYLWIGTSSGLYRLDRATGVLEARHAHGLSGDYVLAIYEDQASALWVGTFGGGINLWDGANDRFTHYRHVPGEPSSLGNDVVLSLCPGLAGTLWIGTQGGLSRFDRATQAFTHYTEKDGLAGNSVGCMLADADGYLWLGTNKGLSRFDPQTESFRNYGARDGLQGGEFVDGACFQSTSGEMFFGGFQGLNAFYPGQIKPNPHAPPLAITAFKKFNQTVRTDLPANEHLQLSYRDNFISFEFAALDYAAPEKNQYAYMMQGLEDDWVYAGTRRYAEYRNLRPGEYVLRVKGANNDGIWNEEGIAIRLTVAPPLWEALWFRGIALLVLAGGVVGAYRLRIRNIEARSRELEEQVQQRTAELSRTNALLRREMDERQRAEEALAQQAARAAVAAERNRLARDMHDSVTQSLYSLTLLAEAGQRMIQARDLQQIEGNQARLSAIVQQALQEMRLLVFELRPLVLKTEGLIGALEHRLEAVERRAGIDARLVVEGACDLPPRVQEELYRIAQEALNNALKHTQALAVKVTLQAENGNVLLEVRDDGQGFDPETIGAKKGLGLVSMRERARKIGGRLTIRSSPDKGTSVKVSVKRIVLHQEVSR